MKSAIAFVLVALLVPAAFAADNPKVVFETSMGNITMELYPGKAPVTVKNFLSYVDKGYYSGTIFHRVIDGFMIQGGGFDKNYMRKDTDPPIKIEADNGLSNARGTVAMARTMDPNSATAQFFINLVDNKRLDFTAKTETGWGYAVFGKVVDGMAVVDKIAKLKTGPGGPFEKDVPSPQVEILKAYQQAAAKPAAAPKKK
jgi:cyclophilin family peptidyl-prolyl cis-trans isomerase